MPLVEDPPVLNVKMDYESARWSDGRNKFTLQELFDQVSNRPDAGQIKRRLLQDTDRAIDMYKDFIKQVDKMRCELNKNVKELQRQVEDVKPGWGVW